MVLGPEALRLKIMYSILVMWAASTCAATAVWAAEAQRMDGVPLEAVETFPNLKNHEVSLGAGIYPFNAYNYDLAVGAGYTYHFSNTFAWEVVHGDQYFSVAKGLTSELADKYKVNPATIEKVQTNISTNVVFYFLNGKFAFLKDTIRYFRTGLLTGPSLVLTDQRNGLGVDLGLRFEFFSGESMVWKFEARDTVSIGGIENLMSFAVGTGFRF